MISHLLTLSLHYYLLCTYEKHVAIILEYYTVLCNDIHCTPLYLLLKHEYAWTNLVQVNIQKAGVNNLHGQLHTYSLKSYDFQI